ncbi:MAG: hypothetical protein RL459_120 [Pseudomonadota bacterium]|jgi:xanthine/uracil permease
MASKQQLKRVQALVWILIYGGLLGIVVSAFMGPSDAATIFTLRVCGSMAVMVGVALIYLRSRMTEDR